VESALSLRPRRPHGADAGGGCPSASLPTHTTLPLRARAIAALRWRSAVLRSTLAPMPPSNEPDDALVRAIAGGDRGAVAALYDRHAPLLLGVALRMLRSKPEAEDLLHDVFLEAWRHASEFDSVRGSVRSWLLMRLRSRALDRLRSIGYTRVVALEQPLEPQAGVTFPVEMAGADAARVRKAMATLGAEQQTLLELMYFEGLSLSEIASREHAPLGTVKSRLARALAQLRLHLADAPGEQP
jgi:RNA polymerase sigma-70 factor, ECF subfamily